MRAAILVLLVAACRIPDERFAIRDGDAGDDDGMHDAMPDGPPAPRGKVYVADPGGGILFTQPGIFLIVKDVQGNLALPSASITNPTSSADASAMLVGKDGTQLYALESGATQLAHYAIQSDGVLVRQTDKLTLATAGVYMALDPTGRWIAVVSGTNTIVIATLDATGKLVSQTSKAVSMTKFHQVAFTRDGACLIGASNGAGGTPPPRIYSIQFAAGMLTTSVSQVAPTNAAALALHPGGTLAYVAGTIPGGGTSVQAFQLGAGCTLGTGGAAMTATTTDFAGGLVADPAGRYLFSTGNSITRITLDGSGGMTTDHATYLTQMPPMGGMTQPGVQAALDPAVPDRLYAVGPGYLQGSRPGAIAASIDAAGALAQVSGAFPCAANGVPQALVLAP